MHAPTQAPATPLAAQSMLLRKKSTWRGDWNVREALVVRGRTEDAALVWHGGAQPGTVALDGDCTVSLQGDQLTVRREGQKLSFRAAPGGPSLGEIQAALDSAMAPSAEQSAAFRATPAAAEFEYEGDRNARGQREGHGAHLCLSAMPLP